jgi:hypothetical protein
LPPEEPTVDEKSLAWLWATVGGTGGIATAGGASYGAVAVLRRRRLHREMDVKQSAFKEEISKSQELLQDAMAKKASNPMAAAVDIGELEEILDEAEKLRKEIKGKKH